MIIRDNFCKFCIKIYVVTLHLNRPDEVSQHMVSMRNKKNYPLIIIEYPLLCIVFAFSVCYSFG